MSFFDRGVGDGLFDPEDIFGLEAGPDGFNPISTAAAFWRDGDYVEAAGVGSWISALAGGNSLDTATFAAKANRGAPLFFPGSSKVTFNALNTLASADTWVDMQGTGDCHVVAVVDLDHVIPSVGGALYDPAAFHISGGNSGISFRSEVGGTEFWADFHYASGASGDAATFDGFKVASVEITSYLNAKGRGRVVIQAKKEGGYVWIRVGTDAWVQGDACYDMWTPAETATLVVGSDYAGSYVLDGTVRALGFYVGAKDDATWSDLFAGWVNDTIPADSTLTGFFKIGGYSATGGPGGVGQWTAELVDLDSDGARDFVAPDAANSPADVTINSLTGADADGSNDYADVVYLAPAGHFTKENGEEYTIGVAFLGSNPAVLDLLFGSTTQAPYSGSGLVCDGVGYFTLGWCEDNGSVVVFGGSYDGIPRDNGGGDNDGWQMVEVAAAADTPHYVQLRLRGNADTEMLDIRVDGGAWVSLPCATCGYLAGVLRFANNYAVNAPVDADFAVIHIDRVALTDTEADARLAQAEAITGWSLNGAGPQDIDANDIASAEAFDTPTVSPGAVTVSPSSVSSTEAFGTATVSPGAVTVSPTSIASAEALGTPTITTGAVTVSPSSIASAEAHGSPVITTGAVTVAPSSIGSAEAVSTPAVAPGAVTASPTAIASAESFGTPAITTGAVTVAPSSAASAEAFGSPQLNENVTGAGGVASAEAFGTPAITTGAVTVSPSSIASAEALGSPQLNENVVAGSVASAEAFDAPTITTGAVTVSPSSITSEESVEAPFVGVLISPNSIASAEAVSTPAITTGAVTVSPSSVASAEAFGAPSVGQVVAPSSIGTGEALGAPALSLNVAAGSVASAEAFGSPTLHQNITAGSVASAETFGTAAIAGYAALAPSSVASAEVFDSPTLTPGAVALAPSAIASAEAFGAPALGLSVAPGSVASAEAFGTPAATPGAVSVAPTGIPSGEAVEDPFVGSLMVPGEIPSEEAFGAPTLAPGAVSVAPSPIGTAEAFGAPALALGLSAAAIPSGEAVGAPALGLNVAGAGGVASAEAVSAASLALSVAQAGGVGTGEAFGPPALGLALAGAGGVASAEAFGTPSAVHVVAPTGIPSEEAAGTPALATGAVTLTPNPVASGEAFDAPVLAIFGAMLSEVGGIPSGEAFDAQLVARWPLLIASGNPDELELGPVEAAAVVE